MIRTIDRCQQLEATDGGEQPNAENPPRHNCQRIKPSQNYRCHCTRCGRQSRLAGRIFKTRRRPTCKCCGGIVVIPAKLPPRR
jgi:hypothetical protein